MLRARGVAAGCGLRAPACPSLKIAEQAERAVLAPKAVLPQPSYGIAQVVDLFDPLHHSTPYSTIHVQFTDSSLSRPFSLCPPPPAPRLIEKLRLMPTPHYRTTGDEQWLGCVAVTDGDGPLLSPTSNGGGRGGKSSTAPFLHPKSATVTRGGPCLAVAIGRLAASTLVHAHQGLCLLIQPSFSNGTEVVCVKQEDPLGNCICVAEERARACVTGRWSRNPVQHMQEMDRGSTSYRVASGQHELSWAIMLQGERDTVPTPACSCIMSPVIIVCA